MKNTLLMFGMAGLAAVVLSSFVVGGNDDNGQQPKKSRHVRLVKIENGKKMEIDTVFANDDVFVWQGDTINPMKHKGGMMVHRFGKGDGKANVMVFKQRDGKGEDPMFFDMKTADDMDVLIDNNDTTGKKVMIRKIMRDSPDGNVMFFRGHGPGHFPPVPPVPPAPPVPHIMKFKHSGKVIDLNDPNVISYKKKDLSGGREKIEIIRKKADENEAETFNFQFDEPNLMAPEAPDAPEMIWESKDDSIKTKIIERKKVIKGKEGKEIEVKVETEKK